MAVADRPQEGSGGTGAEEAWLTDWWLSGYVESLRGDERRRLQFHYSPSLVTGTGPLLLIRHISLWALRCRSLSRRHLLPFKATFCDSPPHFNPLAFYLFFSSPSSHQFLLPCVVHDVNAAAGPVLVRSSPLLRIAFAPPPLCTPL